jgi:hypothetical protein
MLLIYLYIHDVRSHSFLLVLNKRVNQWGFRLTYIIHIVYTHNSQSSFPPINPTALPHIQLSLLRMYFMCSLLGFCSFLNLCFRDATFIF